MVLGTALVDRLPTDAGIVGLAVVAVATLLVNLILLRLLAARIVSDALRILPVPQRHANRLGRLLRLQPAATA
jgi:hypothetical protein